MIKDTKFIFTLTLLLSLNCLAYYVLNFVSFKKHTNNNTQEFLTKLYVIDSSDFEYRDFVKKVKVPLKVTKKIITERKVVADIKPASEEIIKIFEKKSPQKKDIYSKLRAKFKKTNDYKIALKLSRLYYAKRDYKSSLKWAKVANELNDKDDGSWILFAKSKIKLGDKELAKKALLTYSRVYDSKKVDELLGRMSL